MWAWILANPKSVIMVVCLIAFVVLVGIVQYQHHALSMLEGELREHKAIVKEQETALAVVKVQSDRMKAIEGANSRMQGMMSNIPENVRRKLQDESVETINRCISTWFLTRKLPAECENYKASLPKTSTTNTGG